MSDGDDRDAVGVGGFREAGDDGVDAGLGIGGEDGMEGIEDDQAGVVYGANRLLEDVGVGGEGEGEKRGFRVRGSV